MLNKSKGNMYPWVTHTWNPIKGRCPHDCQYCYMRRYWGKIGKLRLDERCLNDNLGSGNIIFVGSSTDMWADEIPDEWIIKVLNYLDIYPDNTYLFQSKNPKRFFDIYFTHKFPKNTILGTTIETDKNYNVSKAPSTFDRYLWIKRCSEYLTYKVMVSIEPIMDFDFRLINWIREIQPSFVSIGADSKGNSLPEPPAWKVERLIEELKKFTEVKIKKNLNRILEEKVEEENEG